MIGPASPGQAEAFARAVWTAEQERTARRAVGSWALVVVFAVLAVAAVVVAVVLSLTQPPLSGATVAAGVLLALAGLFTWDALEIARAVR